MLSDNSVTPNKFTYPSVLKVCSCIGDAQLGRTVHGMVVKVGLDSDGFVVTSLLRMYVMCGCMKDANLLFSRSVNGCGELSEEKKREGNVVLWNVMVDRLVRLGDLVAAREMSDRMPKRSVVSWNAMISSYAQSGLFREALEMFRDMQKSGGVRPNYVTLVSVLPAISRLGVLELGTWVRLYARKCEIRIDDVLGSALVDMYSKCGSIEKAVLIFEQLLKRIAITWNAMISGLAMHGRVRDALDCFSKMERAGIVPSDVTYIGLLSACSHGGMVGQGRSFFNHMVNVVGLEPRIEHYGCMVDLLGRAGLLEEAKELIQNMPVEADDVIWKALLGACKRHGNIEMVKRIAKTLMELAPRDSGSYVALSNMYASLGNWEAVSHVRLLMKDTNIRKDPGGSLIEIDGVVHELLVEDESHFRAEEIHSMLEEISHQLKLEDYMPNTTQVLLNIDEEEKQSVLHYHSEKIAVACGLISTAPETPLRIVKNLRICEDCLYEVNIKNIQTKDHYS